MVPSCVPADWGSVDVVRAVLGLLRAALEDPTVQYVLLVSDSCVPAVSLRDTVAALQAQPRVWMPVSVPASPVEEEFKARVDAGDDVPPCAAVHGLMLC